MAFLKKQNIFFFFWLAFAWGLIFLFVSDERAECTTAEVIFFLLEGENFPFFDADGQSGMSTDNTTQTEEKNTHLLFYFFSVFRYYAALWLVTGTRRDPQTGEETEKRDSPEIRPVLWANEKTLWLSYSLSVQLFLLCVCTSSFPSLVASQSASSRACSLFKKIKKYMLYFCEEERERDALLSLFFFSII